MKKKILTVFCLTDAALAAFLLLRAGFTAFLLIRKTASVGGVGIIGGGGFPSALILREWILPAVLLILLLIPALIWLILLKKADKRKE